MANMPDELRKTLVPTKVKYVLERSLYNYGGIRGRSSQREICSGKTVTQRWRSESLAVSSPVILSQIERWKWFRARLVDVVANVESATLPQAALW